MNTSTIEIDVDSLAPGSKISISYVERDQVPKGWEKPWFGGQNAPWAVPISAGVMTHPDNQRLVSQFREMCDGAINLNTHKWAITKHYSDASTPTVRLEVDRPEWCNLTTGDRIPWQADWNHGNDGDSYVAIIDRQTGKCFLIWKARYDIGNNVMRCGTANRVTSTGGAHGPDGNIWTKENGYQPSRAAGIALPHMLVTREELEDGEINHCLAVALPNPSRDTRVAPAIKNIGVTGSPGRGRLGTGFRFAFEIPESDVVAWANGFRGEQRKYAAAIGHAVVEYGFIIVDNGGNRDRKIGSVYFEHDASADWDSINFPQRAAQGMLTSLLRPHVGSVYFLEEPSMEDIHDVAMYPGVNYSTDR